MKWFSILITLIVVIALIALGYWIVMKYLAGNSGTDEVKLIELCNIWKNEYQCVDDNYNDNNLPGLASLCEKRYPQQDKNDDGINDHCKAMCTVGDCNPYYGIGGDTRLGGEMQ